jgi:acyl-CoA synthetase (NDP forming)
MGRDLSRLLSPRSIAVIGASPKPASVAGEILRNLSKCGFSGGIYPVNPKYGDVGGIRCFPSVAALPKGIDLAILAVNRDLVLGAVEDCGRRGIRDLVIITAGFKESGPEGVARETALRTLIERHDLGVVGPNCMGIIRSVPDVRLNASFSRWFPQGGGIGFISQSGSVGETLLECFEDAGLGVSLFVNLGNRAGLSENDFLAHLETDPACSAVFLYLESFADPSGFRPLVERISRRKPVVVLKVGRTEAGAAAVASHTGSLASSDAVVDAFLQQCGALRVSTIQETLTALRALERGVLPRSASVVILTNAGGAGIIAADACERLGIEVPTLSDETRRRLAQFLPPEAGLGNPIDMIATAGASDYRRSLEIGLEEADAAIVIFRPPLVLKDSPEAVADGIVAVAQTQSTKPILVSTLSDETTETVRRLRAAKLPVYAMPETAVDALSVLNRARSVREEGRAVEEVARTDPAAAQAVIRAARAAGQQGLYFDEGARILSAYGVSVCPYAYLEKGDRPDRAVVERLGFPMVVKLDSPLLFHRFEKGAVLTGIKSEAELAAAIRQLRKVAESLGPIGARVMLQKTLVGRELIYGLERDPSFGPVAMFGIGGTFVEALHDVVFAVVPITSAQAERTVRSIRAFRLLEAFRGQEQVDLSALVGTLQAVGRLGADLPELREIDLNPVIADAHGAAVVDILMKF